MILIVDITGRGTLTHLLLGVIRGTDVSFCSVQLGPGKANVMGLILWKAGGGTHENNAY